MTTIELLVDIMIKQGYFNATKPLTFTNLDHLQNQAKELEKEQLHKVWKASEQNMRSQFSSSAYKNVTFDEYYEALRSKKY